MGGSAGPRSVALAARYADEYNTTFVTPGEAAERREAVMRACERAGREPIPFSIMTGLLVASDESQLRNRASLLAEKIGANADQLLGEPPSGWIVGTIDAAVQQLEAFREAGAQRVFCQQLLHEDLDAVALLGEQLAPAVA